MFDYKDFVITNVVGIIASNYVNYVLFGTTILDLIRYDAGALSVLISLYFCIPQNKVPELL